jgi:succinate dehydrogenase / fumarate reductase, cytochrome b subunit
MSKSALFKSSIAKKIWMGLTGLFLISFLLVHASINALIFFNDGGETFNDWAHFMGTNVFIRTGEIVLFVGLIVHIADGLVLYFKNRAARPVKYSYEKPSTNSSWYSRSMALLGTLLLIFLIIHLAHFWVKSRITGLEAYGESALGQENLYAVMVEVFANPLIVLVYVLGCISLFWHLLHGFKSAFQTIGINHPKYNGIISTAGITYSIIIPALFAAMPIAMFLKWIK